MIITPSTKIANSVLYMVGKYFRAWCPLSKTIISIHVLVLDCILNSFLFNINIFNKDGTNPKGSLGYIEDLLYNTCTIKQCQLEWL